MEKIIINKLDERWEDKLLPIMAMNDNLSLGGSLALYILNIINYDFKNRTPDLDFSLLEPFNESQFSHLVDFFSLEIIDNNYERVGDDTKLPLKILNRELICLRNRDGVDDLIHWVDNYKVDFFNNSYLKKKDWFELDYFGTNIKLTHPSIIFSAKMKYATDDRVGKWFKHFEDIKSIDWPNYQRIIKYIRPSFIESTTTTDTLEYPEIDKWVFNKKELNTTFEFEQDSLPF